MLLCTVRDCREPLSRTDRTAICQRGHSFDIARSGYLNLLQPQDRRSKTPGDSAEAVAGRRAVYDLGIAAPLADAVAELAAPVAADEVLDAGCGEGWYLAQLAERSGCRAHGLDISVPAIEAAARRYPAHEWVVANADRFIPYEGACFDLVLSITARMNPAEFRRVLRPRGRLLIALPAPDDLIELRGHGRDDRVDRTVAEFETAFALYNTRRATTHADLTSELAAGLLHSVYRPLGHPPESGLRVTFSLDLLLFHPR